MHNLYKIIVVQALILVALSTSAQNKIDIKPKKMKGTFYISWGYNREAYTKSDIRFKNNTNDNYDFTLVDAAAHDKPGFNNGLNDFLSKDLTIPQYQLHIGYLFKDKHNLGIELSWDHLKYVVYDNVTIHVQGNIRGNVIDKDTFVDPSFVHLQHTNGNNYLMLNIVKMHPLWKSKYVNVSAIGKAGAGPLVSYSISTVLNEPYDTWFHIQGLVVGGTLGARIDIFKYLFIQPSFQLAWADYIKTQVGKGGEGVASHMFASYCFMLEGGFNIPLSK
jgi:hypothetical protein